MGEIEHGMGSYRSDSAIATGYGSFATDADAVAWVEAHLQHEPPSVKWIDLHRQADGAGTVVARWRRDGDEPWRSV